MKKYNENLLELLSLSKKMKNLADKGLQECKDYNCINLYGLLKDFAYKLLKEAEKEIFSHKSKNKWN